MFKKIVVTLIVLNVVFWGLVFWMLNEQTKEIDCMFQPVTEVPQHCLKYLEGK